MLVFFKANLALFATPKTGSSAYHIVLKRYAEVALLNQSKVKHMTVRKYHRHLAPFLKDAYDISPERVAVMRDPVSQARSWYSYRQRPRTKGTANSTLGISFDEFIEQMLQPKPPQFAQIGSQATFLSLPEGGLGVEHLFAYEKLDLFHGFMEKRIGTTFKTKKINVSPTLPAPLSPALEERFRAARKDDFDLYDRMMAAGGHLQTDLGLKTG